MARNDSNILNKYDFTEGSGTLINDVSSVTPLINPTIQDDTLVTWISGQGITFNGTYAYKSGNSDACSKMNTLETNDVFTFETWVKSANITQGDSSHISAVSGHNNSTNYRNFLFGQIDDKYSFLLTDHDTDDSGIIFNTTTTVVTSEPQHVVLTIDIPNHEAKIYLNSVYKETIDISSIPYLYMRSDWHHSIGGEMWGTNFYYGNIYLIAYHSTLLTQQDITDNYNAGFNGYSPILPTLTTNDASDLTINSATLNGDINPNGVDVDYYFEYGTSESFGSNTTPQASGAGNTDLSVSSGISGLSENTLYYFRLSTDSVKGNTKQFTTLTTPGTPYYANDISFTTLSSSTSITITSQPTDSNVKVKDTAAFYCEFSGPSNKGYQWWKNDNIKLSNDSKYSGATSSNLNILNIQDSDNGDSYKCECKDMDTYDASGSFTYSNNAYINIIESPVVETLDATNVDATSFSANADINPHGHSTTHYFEYGTDNTFSTHSSTPTRSDGSNNSNINVSENISGLSENTLYYFRVVSENSEGTVIGNTKSITTSEPTAEWTDEGLKTYDGVKIISESSANELVSKIKTSGQFTVELWINPSNATIDHTGTIFAVEDDPALSPNFSLRQNTDSYIVIIKIDSSPHNIGTGVNVSTGWHHIVVTYDGSDVKFYVDKVLEQTTNISGSLSGWSDTAKISVASSDGSSNWSWPGEYQMVSIYDTVLTQTEIEQNYNAGRNV